MAEPSTEHLNYLPFGSNAILLYENLFVDYCHGVTQGIHQLPPRAKSDSGSVAYFTPVQGYPTPPSIFLRGQLLAYNSRQTSGGNVVSLSGRRNASSFVLLTGVIH
ncbi:hypothetical protein MHYP_G00123290 [Metynnis hypsauchen]